MHRGSKKYIYTLVLRLVCGLEIKPALVVYWGEFFALIEIDEQLPCFFISYPFTLCVLRYGPR